MVYKWATKEWFESMFDSLELDTLGDKWGHRWKGSQKFRHRLSFKLIKEIVKKGENLAILDIGCGLGEFTAKVYQLNPKNSIYGIDISQKAIDYVSKKYQWLQAKVGALPEIPFPNDSFDLVIALEVLYYLNSEDREKAVKDMKRVLKDGGYLLLSGVLDGGKRYFSEKEIIQLLSKYFSLETIQFNYAKPYTYIESGVLNLYSKLVGVQRLAALSSEEFQNFLNERSMTNAQAYILHKVRRLFSMPLLGSVLRIFFHSSSWLLRVILSLESIPAFFFVFSKLLVGETAKSQIMILAQKKVKRGGDLYDKKNLS
ncbi:MAG: methyltransferase domain-containing protein [Thermoplasmata archaeon]|nr:methyltransferase domain-containing protein [Thermoplasmata archaeon]